MNKVRTQSRPIKWTNNAFNSFLMTLMKTVIMCKRHYTCTTICSKVTALFYNSRWRLTRYWNVLECSYSPNVENALWKPLCFPILWKLIKLFKNYSTLSIYKMVITAILYFVKMLNLTNLLKNMPLLLLFRQIWWQSDERFKSYSICFIYKTAAFGKIYSINSPTIVCHLYSKQ